MALTGSSTSEYRWQDAHATDAHSYLWPALRSILSEEAPGACSPRDFDLCCGNGATANMLAGLGYDVVGVDASEEGVALANEAYPQLNLQVGSV